MKKIFDIGAVRIVVLPILGAIGALVAVVWPVGHQTFCSGLQGLVL